MERPKIKTLHPDWEKSSRNIQEEWKLKWQKL